MGGMMEKRSMTHVGKMACRLKSGSGCDRGCDLVTFPFSEVIIKN